MQEDQFENSYAVRLAGVSSPDADEDLLLRTVTADRAEDVVLAAIRSPGTTPRVLEAALANADRPNGHRSIGVVLAAINHPLLTSDLVRRAFAGEFGPIAAGFAAGSRAASSEQLERVCADGMPGHLRALARSVFTPPDIVARIFRVTLALTHSWSAAHRVSRQEKVRVTELDPINALGICMDAATNPRLPVRLILSSLKDKRLIESVATNPSLPLNEFPALLSSEVMWVRVAVVDNKALPLEFIDVALIDASELVRSKASVHPAIPDDVSRFVRHGWRLGPATAFAAAGLESAPDVGSLEALIALAAYFPGVTPAAATWFES